MRATIEIFIKLFDSKIKVLCIDEPELGLEPYLQKFLLRALKEKAGPEKRVVLATHSHHFLDMESVSNNYLANRTSSGKIRLSEVTDLKEVIFRLLGNTLSSFLLPEKVIILEGPSDFTFVKQVSILLGKEGYAFHGSGGIGNVTYATNSISQFLKFNEDNLSVYKERMFVIVDKPTKDKIVREWKLLLDDDEQTRICVLPQNGIEYYYPEQILQQIFETTSSRDEVINGYLASSPASYNGIEISKTKLARKVAELLREEDLADERNELFQFLRQTP
jgi:predicted ATP-dependent endonuclease of OLD family